KTKMRMRRRRK
ncbi:hypothetical protein CFC21_057124, partial [Triticum aestivum]